MKCHARTLLGLLMFHKTVYFFQSFTMALTGVHLLLLLHLLCSAPSIHSFDVRQHLSTATKYSAAKALTDAIFEDDVTPPEGCFPIHLNLLARHGTRAPTKKRVKQLDEFAVRLKILSESSPKEDIPVWLHGWQSPWKGRKAGGELISEGEKEMFELAKRLRHMFPDIFKYDYHPDIYPISATQVPRASASAVAFGMGLFHNKGSLGDGQNRAFAVISDSRSIDHHLRFYESCRAYREFKVSETPVVEDLKQEAYTLISESLNERFKLNTTIDDIAVLWYLCKQEATVLDVVDRACSLFTSNNVELLEWTDDLELHYLKGYGQSLNYRMGVPLLENVIQSIEKAITAEQEGEKANFLERAKLRFAHAETLIPFTCLLGLFLNAKDVKLIRNEQAMAPPQQPPNQRSWKGSLVASYGANTALVLYKCPGMKTGGDSIDEFSVQVLHNEKPVILPACNGSHFCPYKVFKEEVVLPHLKYSFETVCLVEPKAAEVSKCSWGCWLPNFISRFFKGHISAHSCEDKSEL